MTPDLKLMGKDYQWLLTIFYITYIIFEFQTLMWKIVPPQYVSSKTNPLPEQISVSLDLFPDCWFLQIRPMARVYLFICLC